jgi:hypothetical protein
VPSVNATERAMPVEGSSESVPLVGVAIERCVTMGLDLQKLGSIGPLNASAADKPPEHFLSQCSVN